MNCNQIKLLILVLFPSLLLAQTAQVNPQIEYQLIRGFGGMNHSVWIGDINQDVREKAFGNEPGQLGLSILRNYISPNPNQWAGEVETALFAQSQGAIVFSSPWNPPAELLDPNASFNRILPSSYGAYVNHLNAFSDFMIDNGVNLYAISVQNEPDYGEEGSWTEWSSSEMVSFMANHAQNLNDHVMAPESFQFRRNFSDPILNNEAANANLDIMGGHIYGGGLFDYPLAREKGKEVWMTEHYTSSNQSANNWPDALLVGVEIHDCMEENFNAYVWWYIRRFYGLITDDGNITKRGYVFSHFSKFVRPGYVRVDVTNNTPLEITAYKGPNNELVVVVINDGNTNQSLSLNVGDTEITELTKITTSNQINLRNEGIVNVDNGVFSDQIESYSISTFTTNPEGVGRSGNVGPVANAGNDITVTDVDNNGFETITLDAGGSTDSDGTITNYSWAMLVSEELEQIGTGSTIDLDLPVGSHEITLTVTDNDGERASDMINVVVEIDGNIVQNDIWLDVECATVGSNWQLRSDLGASNQQYVATRPGQESLAAPSESEEDLLIIPFNVTQAGIYRPWGRVRVPSPDDDSFWVRLDDGEWVLWNSISGGAGWSWDDIHDSNNGNIALTYNLSEGDHTMYICYREDGADLDKLFLTNTGNSPTGLGEPDQTCGPGEILSVEDEVRLKIYPNPATDQLTIESEISFNKISIFDLNGKEVSVQAFKKGVNLTHTSLKLNQGIYSVIIETDSAPVIKQLLIH